jgi:hypothetical protein
MLDAGRVHRDSVIVPINYGGVSDEAHTKEVAVDVRPAGPRLEASGGVAPEVVRSQGRTPDHPSEQHGHEAHVPVGRQRGVRVLQIRCK